jgi:hypothetical protein
MHGNPTRNRPTAQQSVCGSGFSITVGSGSTVHKGTFVSAPEGLSRAWRQAFGPLLDALGGQSFGREGLPMKTDEV